MINVTRPPGLQLPRPTHALGKMIQAQEEGVPFVITGTDWPTRDGSGLRDYVHVWDLAAAHVAALIRFDALPGLGPVGRAPLGLTVVVEHDRDQPQTCLQYLRI